MHLQQWLRYHNTNTAQNKTGDVRRNVALRRVRETIVAVERQ